MFSIEWGTSDQASHGSKFMSAEFSSNRSHRIRQRRNSAYSDAVTGLMLDVEDEQTEVSDRRGYSGNVAL